MNFRDPLEIKLKEDGKNIEKGVIDLFYKNHTPISREERAMVKPYLTAELKKFSVEYYDAEFGEKVLTGALNDLVKKCSDISTLEIKYCFGQIIKLGKVKPFSINDLIFFVKSYVSDKKKVTETYHLVKEKLWKKEEDKKTAFNFLQNALKKNSKGEHLTIYEKVSIGNHIASTWTKEQIEAVEKEAEQSLPRMQESLSRLNDKGFAAHLEDEEQNKPVWWTPKLLFGSLVFESQPKK